ncbi:hypothetical protein ACHAXS_014367 [Conticribra weissflogii]
MPVIMVQRPSNRVLHPLFSSQSSIILLLIFLATLTIPTSSSFQPISLPTRRFPTPNNHLLQPQGIEHHRCPSSQSYHNQRRKKNQPQIMGSALSSSSDSKDPHPLTPLAKSTFRNKSILLTGASRGLGKSLARQLSKCRPSALILSGRDEAALEEVKLECLRIFSEECKNAEDFGEDGGDDVAPKTMNVHTITCDLGDASSVENLASQALHLSCNGIIDVLINNGGISSRSSFLETKLDVDEKVMRVNFFSGVALAKRLVPRMVAVGEGGGEGEKEMTRKIIWVSSVQGKREFNSELVLENWYFGCFTSSFSIRCFYFILRHAKSYSFAVDPLGFLSSCVNTIKSIREKFL